MSFILDALRKSDAERQRTATPGIADARYVGRKIPRNFWLPVLVVVLAANVVVMSVQWLRRPDPALSRPAATEWVVPVAPPAAPLPDEVRPLAREVESTPPPESLTEPPMVRRDIPEAPVIAEGGATPPPAVAQAEDSGRPPPREPVAESVPEPAAQPRVRSGPPASPGAADTPPTLDLPSADQLVASGQLRVPSLNLDLHVYSGTPTDRFVVINSRRYGEGARLAEGPTIETITADGVILANAGTRFLLQRK